MLQQKETLQVVSGKSLGNKNYIFDISYLALFD